MIVHLNQFEHSDQGSVSVLSVPDIGFACYCLELPWNNNERSISRIPKGEYDVVIRRSNKYGFTYHVTNVPDRSYILIHSGNYAGDTSKGFKTHSKGCLLLGQRVGRIGKQRAVLNSRITVRKFMSLMNNEPFKLIKL